MKPKPARRGPARALGQLSARDAITAALRFHGIADQVRGQRILTEWSELVGPRIAQRTRPEGIVDRVLWVEVATSPWMHELATLRPELTKGLFERLGEPRLFDELRFKLAGGDRRAPVIERRARSHPPGAHPTVFPATGAAREKIVEEVAVVDDAELRELIARIRITNDR